MKKKKGFTLVEIIVVVAMLIVIAGLFSINMIRTLDKNKDVENQTIISTVTSAADAYVSSNPEKIERLFNGYGYVDMTVGELRESGLISIDLINPDTGEEIKDDEIVRAKLENSEQTDLVKFVFPVSAAEIAEKSYSLMADDLYIKYDKNTTRDYWCSSNEAMSGLRIVDNSTQGKLYTGDAVTDFKIKVLSCNVNPQSAGTYQVRYEYTDISTQDVKTGARTVYVTSSPDDIISYTVVINNGKSIPINAKSVPIKIVEKKSSGSSNTINTTNQTIGEKGYTIENFSTATTGTRTATIISKKVNSDGSKAASVMASYTVTNSLKVLVEEDKGTPVEKQPNEEYYFTGQQTNNYVQLKKDTTAIFRIYYMNTNNMKIIYDKNDITSPYNLISICHPTSCCNGGRYVYYQLGGSTRTTATAAFYYNNSQSTQTMDTVISNFYQNKVAKANLTSRLNRTKSSDNQLRNATLLGKNEYIKIAQCNSSGTGCKSNFLSNSGKNFWLFENAQNTGYRDMQVYNYAVGSNANVYKEGTSIVSYTQHYISPSLVVKPVIELTNPIISGGQGTANDPWIIE